MEAFTSDNTEVTIVALLGIFGVVHSGLAGLRPKGEHIARTRTRARARVCVVLCVRGERHKGFGCSRRRRGQEEAAGFHVWASGRGWRQLRTTPTSFPRLCVSPACLHHTQHLSPPPQTLPPPSNKHAGEALVGPRAYRVFFALVSLPLAVVTVGYFINHRYSGTPLWDLRGVPGVHEAVWLASFVSFFFLYPSTFNILEVAAVDQPKLHLWETGIMRITRHPQV